MGCPHEIGKGLGSRESVVNYSDIKKGAMISVVTPFGSEMDGRIIERGDEARGHSLIRVLFRGVHDSFCDSLYRVEKRKFPTATSEKAIVSRVAGPANSYTERSPFYEEVKEAFLNGTAVSWTIG